MIKFYLSIILSLIITLQLDAQIVIKNDKTPHQIAEILLGKANKGINITEVSYTGSKSSMGVYYTFASYMPINKGIVLSTGSVYDIDGPNQSTNVGTAMFTKGSKALEELVGIKTSDAAIFEVTFTANTNQISFNYSFASEEYPEFVNKGVNDVFALFIYGSGYDSLTNLALLPNSNEFVSVDNINSQVNSEFFISNKTWTGDVSKFAQNKKAGELSYNCEFDGMTKSLTASADIKPFSPYTLIFAIADAGDNIYDSGLIVESGSMQSSGEKVPFQNVLIDDVLAIFDTLDLIDIKVDSNEVQLLSDIQFDFNSFEITNDNYELLNQLVNLFDNYFELNVSIIGHTDNIGTDAYNMVLSEQRAKSVYEYLISNNISSDRLSYIGKGNREPLYTELQTDSRKKNRRVEFVLSK